MRFQKNRFWYLAAVLTIVVGFALVGSAQNNNHNDNAVGPSPGVYPPNTTVLGMSYGDWSAAWWQYVLTFTNDVSPYLDTTGLYCNEGQGGPVFFLAGGPVNPTTRRCTIPAGKALFFPLINVECSTVEPAPFYGRDAQQARACAALWNDGIDIKSLKLTIDGKHVKDLDDFRVQSPFYDFIVPPADNFLGVNGVTSGSSASDGYWVMVKPLSPGMHVIHFEAAWVSGPGAGAVQNVTYILTVNR
jgi:hypothetical protein